MLRAGKQQQRAATRLVGAMIAPAKPVKSPRARAAPATAGIWRPSIFLHAGARMRYWLYLPPPAAIASPVPLLVMLHGCEQTAADFAAGTRMNGCAERAGYAVLYPQQAASSHPRRCWTWYERASRQGGGEAALIAALVREVVAAHAIDGRRVFVAGLSAGAAMAHILALHYPELFAGLGMHSGPVFGVGHGAVGALGVMQRGGGGRAEGAIADVLAAQPGRPALPTMIIHGETDAVVNPLNLAQLAGQAMQLNGLYNASAEKVIDKPATSRTAAYRQHDVTQGRRLLLRVVRIAGLGHAWSGGDAHFKFNAARGPNASTMLLAFFSKIR